MNSQIGFIFIFSLVSANSFAQTLEVSSTNLRDLLQSKNGRVYAAQAQQQAAEERSGSLARSFLPSLDLYGAQETFKTENSEMKTEPTYGAELKVNIYNGGRDLAQSEVRNLELDKQRVQVKRVTAEELEGARSAYWQVLYLQERGALLQLAAENNKQNLQAAQKRIRSGVATDSDRFEFEMKAVDLNQEIAENQIELADYTSKMKLFLGAEESTTLLFKEPYSHDHSFEVDLKKSGLEYEFMYLEPKIQAQQNQAAAKERRRAWLPKVDAFASYSQLNESIHSAGPGATDEAKRESMFGVRLSMNISSAWESRHEGRALLQESQSAKSLADYQKRKIDSEVQTDVSRLKLLHDQVHEAEKNIQRAESYYKRTQSEYNRGVKNSPDVLGASEKLFDMRHKRIQIIKDFQVSKAHILSKSGL